MLRKGECIRGGGPLLQDVQGARIKTFGRRDVSITLQTEDDREVVLKERVTFSDVVAQPILSFGHLLRVGWSIDAKEHCMYNGNVRVPLTFQNNSLVVKGYTRTLVEVGCVRTLKAVLSDKLKNIVDGSIGWRKVGNVWIGYHLS